jgi:hypothetical protein
VNLRSLGDLWGTRDGLLLLFRTAGLVVALSRASSPGADYGDAHPHAAVVQNAQSRSL